MLRIKQECFSKYLSGLKVWTFLDVHPVARYLCHICLLLKQLQFVMLCSVKQN